MSAKVLPIDRDVYRYKMKDLCQASGLDRQAVHFYIQQGLLPPGRKTGRNMAWYTEQHLERLRLIKQLQHERFLPLKAIKALLDGREEVFEPEQQAFLQRVRDRLDLPDTPGGRIGNRDTDELIPLEALKQRTGIDDEDIERGVALGFLTLFERDGEPAVSSEDAWLFETLAEIRAMGFTRERGFAIDDIGFYHDAVSDLLTKEVGLLSARLSNLPTDEASKMITSAIPVINQVLSRTHTRLVREFFQSLPSEQTDTDPQDTP